MTHVHRFLLLKCCPAGDSLQTCQGAEISLVSTISLQRRWKRYSLFFIMEKENENILCISSFLDLCVCKFPNVFGKLKKFLKTHHAPSKTFWFYLEHLGFSNVLLNPQHSSEGTMLRVLLNFCMEQWLLPPWYKDSISIRSVVCIIYIIHIFNFNKYEIHVCAYIYLFQFKYKK